MPSPKKSAIASSRSSMDESSHSFIVWSVMSTAYPSSQEPGGGMQVIKTEHAGRSPAEPSLLEFSANSIACSPVTCENRTSVGRWAGPCDVSDGQEFGVDEVICQQQSHVRFLFRKLAGSESQRKPVWTSTNFFSVQPSSPRSTCIDPADTVCSHGITPDGCRSFAAPRPQT